MFHVAIATFYFLMYLFISLLTSIAEPKWAVFQWYKKQKVLKFFPRKYNQPLHIAPLSVSYQQAVPCDLCERRGKERKKDVKGFHIQVTPDILKLSKHEDIGMSFWND